MFGLTTHLARRLMVYISGSLLSALLFTFTAQYLALQSMLERTRERSLIEMVDSLVPLISNSLWVFHEEDVKKAVQAILRNQFVSGVQINDNSGQFDFRIGDLSEATDAVPNVEKAIFDNSNKAFVVTVPLIVESSVETAHEFNIGSLRVRSDNSLLTQQVNALLKITLISVLVAIACLQILIYFLIRHNVAKPLESITSLIQQLSSNFQSQPEVPELIYRTDEFGRLTRTFQQQRTELIKRDQDLEQHRQHLEQMVEIRTNELQVVNKSLVDSLTQLKRAQHELIQNEKMVSLGTLVSGIAHEVNTPLGVSITAASHLIEEFRHTQKALNENTLTKRSFEEFLTECNQAETLLLNNLMRAAQLIQSFKQVSVDQSSDEQRLINLKGYLDEIVLSLRPKLKHTSITVHNDVPDDISIHLAPGALAQIMTNLITNSILHGFKGGTVEGDIYIDAEASGSELYLKYQDNGAGMDENTLKRFYDPFFTTKRSEGGSGLGMNIVYNLVTSKLNGSIESFSSPNNGLKVDMRIKIIEDAVQQESLHER